MSLIKISPAIGGVYFLLAIPVVLLLSFSYKLFLFSFIPPVIGTEVKHIEICEILCTYVSMWFKKVFTT